MRHKLVTYILKNPPKSGKGSKGKSGGKGMTAEANVGGPLVFEKGANGTGNGNGNGDGEGSEEEPSTPDAGNAVPTTGTDIDAALGRADPVLSNPDASEEVSRKLKAMEMGGGDDDEDEDADSPYALLGAWLAEHRDASDADIIGQIKENGIVGKHKVLLEIGHHLFTDEVADEVPKRTSLLSVLVTGEKHQKSLLGGLERLLAYSDESDALLANGTTSKVLMALYQADVLDEEVIRTWGTHVSKKYVDKDKSKKVRKSADAFLKVCLFLFLPPLALSSHEGCMVARGLHAPGISKITGQG